MKGHHSRNKILYIHDENGLCFTDSTEVKDTIMVTLRSVWEVLILIHFLILLLFMELSLEDYLPLKV